MKKLLPLLFIAALFLGCETSERTISVTSVTLDQATMELAVHGWGQLFATVLPENATNQNITWTSSDPDVVTVDVSGWGGGGLTAVSPGTATITVTTEDGGRTARATVTVTHSPAQHIAIIPRSSWYMMTDETLQFTAYVYPSTAYQRVTWASSDPTVVAINANGLATSISGGTASITATSIDGTTTPLPTLITVTPRYVPITSLTLNKDEVTLMVGETATLVATIIPENATRSVRWISRYSQIATINDNGVITALRSGSTTIIAHVGDNRNDASITVTVNAPIGVTGVTLNRTSANLNIGSTEVLTATVIPANATNQNIVWTSSNPAVASVNSNGVVTAVSLGSATITVTTIDGNFTATYIVTVIPENGVLINGVVWATRNVASPGTFAQNPHDVGMYYQWNRRIGWSSTYPMVNSDGGTTWNNSIPTGTAWYAQNDPCPAGWRVPTQQELQSLIDAGCTWTNNWNGTGVRGRQFGTAPNQIFLPAAGRRSASFNDNGFLRGLGSFGYYQSSTRSNNASQAYAMTFDNGWVRGSWLFWTLRRDGNSVRCVAE